MSDPSRNAVRMCFFTLLALLIVAPFGAVLPPDALFDPDCQDMITQTGLWKLASAIGRAPISSFRTFYFLCGIVGCAWCFNVAVFGPLIRPDYRFPVWLRLYYIAGAFAVGWRSYAYWGNGLLVCSAYGLPYSSMWADPKFSEPFMFVESPGMSSLYFLYIFASPIVVLIAVPTLIGTLGTAEGRASRLEFRRDWWLCTIAIVISFVATPGYLEWILD
jgi:hypothetical protein